MAQEDPTGPPTSAKAMQVQINSALAELGLLADQAPDRWRTLVLLNRAIQSLQSTDG